MIRQCGHRSTTVTKSARVEKTGRRNEDRGSGYSPRKSTGLRAFRWNFRRIVGVRRPWMIRSHHQPLCEGRETARRERGRTWWDMGMATRPWRRRDADSVRSRRPLLPDSISAFSLTHPALNASAVSTNLRSALFAWSNGVGRMRCLLPRDKMVDGTNEIEAVWENQIANGWILIHCTFSHSWGFKDARIYRTWIVFNVSKEFTI